jgi:hypothetical protein
MLKLNLKYLFRSNLSLNSFLLAFTVVSLVILDHIVFRVALKILGLRIMILRKVKLVQNLPCLNYVLPHRKQHSQRFVHTYHHCGKIGHTRPNCFKMKPHEHKNDNLHLMNNYEGCVT